MAPTFFRLSKSSGRSRCSSVRHGSRRTSYLYGLEFFAASDAAADIVYDLSESSSHRYLDETGVDDVSGKSECLGAGLFSGPMDLYHSAPFSIMIGTLAKVSTLFKSVGLP